MAKSRASIILPRLRLRVVMLHSRDGGRNSPAYDAGYRPHLVIGEAHPQSSSSVELGAVAEDYLGVEFAGEGVELIPDEPHVVDVRLIHHPRVDYTALRPGTAFSIREGRQTVGYGTVLTLQ